ncbi:ubiquinone/menaquinone biosynthesis-related protein [Morchella snyderi]|nr:ubiquinone/menaquinone biosynthesis-related protein [Morchella snyderi]
MAVTVFIDSGNLPTPPKPRNKAPFILAGIAAYTLTAYGTYVYFSLKNVPEYVPQKQDQTDKSHVFEGIAKDYDREIWASEFFMGMPLLRRALGKRAQGDVLEVSAGTGRNVDYFPVKKCSSITMVDTSASMLKEARKKFQKKYPKYKNASFVVQDAAEPITPPPTGKGYDTVIQSMGLCSHHSPVELLRNLGKICKDDGKIILLEHGRSHYDLLNNALDSLAPKHAETWGCWWNRDIEGILKESGLVIDKVSRYHLGTTYWIEARPAKSSPHKLITKGSNL